MKFKNLKDVSVLFVEDSDTRSATATVLEDYVGELYMAGNGEEGLRIFNQNKVDTVLTDILMPKMTGIELAAKIRKGKVNPDVPIIITTAFVETKYLMDAIKLKCDGYILKPIDIENLLDTIQKAVKPRVKSNEIEYKSLLLDIIEVFVGGKKIEIIKFLVDHLDNDFTFHGGYQDIINELNVSKPTVIRTFKQLIDVGLLVKVKNKVYKLRNDFISLHFGNK